MPKPRESKDHLAILECGHVLEKLHSRKWRCLVCGQSWLSKQRKEIAALGECPGVFMYDHAPNLPDGPRVAPRGSQIIVNGRVLHPTHNLAWHRGIYFCWRCGYHGTLKRVGLLTVRCQGYQTPSQALKLGKLKAGRCPLNSGVWPLAEDAEKPVIFSSLPSMEGGRIVLS